MENNNMTGKDLHDPKGTRATALAKLIARFNESNQVLRSAVEKDDWEAISTADRATSLLFDKILGSTPDNPADMVLLTRFLLDHLQAEATGNFERIKLKIIQLVSLGNER